MKYRHTYTFCLPQSLFHVMQIYRPIKMYNWCFLLQLGWHLCVCACRHIIILTHRPHSTHQEHTHLHTTSHGPLAFFNIRECGSSSSPNEHHDMSLCFPVPLPLPLWSLTWRNSTIAHFCLLFQKQYNCYLFLSSSYVVLVVVVDQRLKTMAYSEEALLWVYLLVRDIDDVVNQ